MPSHNTATSLPSHDSRVNFRGPGCADEYGMYGRTMPATTRVTGIGQAQGLLAEFTTLHSGAAEQLAVLLLRHALTALLDHRSHVGIPHVPCSVPAHAGDVRLMYVDAGPRGDE